MSAHQAIFPVAVMARVLGVSASSFSCVAVSPAVCAHHRGHGVAEADPHRPRQLTRNLRCAAGAGRAQGRRRQARAQAHRYGALIDVLRSCVQTFDEGALLDHLLSVTLNNTKLRDRVREIARDCEPGAVYTATANPTRFRREAVFSGRNHCGTS